MSGSGIVGIETAMQGYFAGQATALNTIANSDVTQFIRKRSAMYSIAAAGATVDTAETGLFYCSKAMTIWAINLLPGAALTASDSVYRTITVSKWTALGGTQTTIAAWVTKTSGASGGTGNWSAMVKVSPTTTLVSAGNLAAGVGVSYAVIHASSGTALPGMCLEIVYSED